MAISAVLREFAASIWWCVAALAAFVYVTRVMFSVGFTLMGRATKYLLDLEQSVFDSLLAEPPILEKPIPIVKAQRFVFFNATMQEAADYALDRIEPYITGYNVILFVIVIFSLRALCAYRRSIAYKLRGIDYEAMRPGSKFIDKQIPAFQVEIYDSGLLYSTFVGYGVRIGNYLVVPTHVHVCIRGEMLLSTAKNSLVLSSSAIRSRLHSDTLYFPLTDTQWSGMGVQKATVPKNTVKTVLVSCAGREGVSSGMLLQTSMVGIYSYTGSTIPGMSGAAYYAGNLVHGIHTGVSGETNVGVSTVLLQKEISRLHFTLGETPTLAEMSGLTKTDVKSGWDTNRLTQYVEKTYDTEWDEGVDYDAELDFENSGVESQITTLIQGFWKLPIASRSAVLNMLKSNITFTGQNTTGDSSQLTLAPTPTVEDRLVALENRVKVIEEKIKDEQSTSTSGTITCNRAKSARNGDSIVCLRQFTTKAALLAHIVVVHPEVDVSGESAYSGDSQRIVKTNNSLNSRRPLPRTKTKSSTGISQDVESTKASTSTEEAQSSTPATKKNSEEALEKLLKDMVGQILDIARK